MGNHPQQKPDPTQIQGQAQGNLQGQLQGQANLQGQGQGQLNLQGQGQGQGQANLQGQGQGQGQGQNETQTAAQSLYDSSANWNGNGNANGNLNGNANLNANDNKADNSLDNKASNFSDNKVDNTVANNVDNKVENTVDTKVNVDVSLDLHASGLSAPVIDLHGMSNFSDSLVMPQVVNQTLNGDGNQFNIDQVNNLVNNGTVTDPNVTFNGGDTKFGSDGFTMDAKATGGDSKVDGHTGDITGASASGITSHADAAVTQDAFTQTLTLGANIQFNSLTMNVAGHDLADSHNLGHS